MGQQYTVADFEELFGVNAGYVEKVYQDFLASPESVGEEWRRFFAEQRPPERAAPAAGDGAPKPATPEAATPGRRPEPAAVDRLEELHGISAKIVQSMQASLAVPT